MLAHILIIKIAKFLKATKISFKTGRIEIISRTVYSNRRSFSVMKTVCISTAHNQIDLLY